MNTHRLLLLIHALLVLISATGQDIDAASGKQLYKSQVIEDLDILYASLVNYHPAPFQYSSEKFLRDVYETARAEVPDTLSEREFHVAIRAMIAAIKCGHTYAKPSESWYESVRKNESHLPFNVTLVDDRLLITNIVEGAYDFETGDEILSINGIKANSLLKQMALIQERDGLTQAHVNIRVLANFRIYYIFLFGIPDSYVIEYRTTSGKVRKTEVEPTNARFQSSDDIEIPSNFNHVINTYWSSFSQDTANNIAYLDIDNFRDRKTYKKYFKFIFNHLQKYPDARLIIDLRHNSGGYFGNANTLLTYLTSEKFDFNFERPKGKFDKNKYTKLDFWGKLTKFGFSVKPSGNKKDGYKTTSFSYKPKKTAFDGDVYVITDGLTFSMGSLVAAQLHQHGAVFFGEETGGTESGTNAMLRYHLVLPNSGIEVYIPYYHVVSNSTKGQEGYGIKPDYVIPNTDDTLNKVIGIINQSN